MPQKWNILRRLRLIAFQMCGYQSWLEFRDYTPCDDADRVQGVGGLVSYFLRFQ